jgi:hypothetical protein
MEGETEGDPGGENEEETEEHGETAEEREATEEESLVSFLRRLGADDELQNRFKTDPYGTMQEERVALAELLGPVIEIDPPGAFRY